MPDEEKNMMRVIVCKPDEYAEVVEIEDSLESMQNMVGGLIEEYMPWDDEVAIICNEEGKMNGLPFNRAIRDENGGIQDVIAGDFFPLQLSLHLKMRTKSDRPEPTAIYNSCFANQCHICNVTLSSCSSPMYRRFIPRKSFHFLPQAQSDTLQVLCQLH